MSRVTALAHKCGCGSVWCIQCFLKRQAKYHFAELAKFNWKKTRQITLTLDRKQFSDGRAAWEHVNNHKKIAGMLRNFKRSYGINISKWKWFLEWHRDGFPHWHLFIEVENKGRAGMIGGDRIRQCWQLGRATESYIHDVKHWNEIIGYFQKHGYFKDKDKNHQIELPAWAREEEHLKIRRSGSKAKARTNKSEFIRAMNYFDKKGDLDVIDIKTGEIIRPGKGKTRRKNKSYKALFAECGQRTRIKIMTDKSLIVGIFDIPYKTIRKKIPGEYKEHAGYSFNVSKKLFDYLFDRVLTIQMFSTEKDCSHIKARIEAWHEHRIKEGYYSYSKVYG